MRNEVPYRAKEDRNILHTINRRHANWIRHILCRNCLLKHVTDGRTEVTGKRGRRCKQLLYEFKEMGGYWKLTEEAPERRRRLWTCRKTNYMMMTTTTTTMMMIEQLIRAACCRSVGVISFYLQKESR
jgi:hypothetical protein